MKYSIKFNINKLIQHLKQYEAYEKYVYPLSDFISPEGLFEGYRELVNERNLIIDRTTMTTVLSIVSMVNDNFPEVLLVNTSKYYKYDNHYRMYAKEFINLAQRGLFVALYVKSVLPSAGFHVVACGKSNCSILLERNKPLGNRISTDITITFGFQYFRVINIRKLINILYSPLSDYIQSILYITKLHTPYSNNKYNLPEYIISAIKDYVSVTKIGLNGSSYFIHKFKVSDTAPKVVYDSDYNIVKDTYTLQLIRAKIGMI